MPKRRPVRKPMRTSLQDEIMLASALYEPPIDVCTRNSYDLRRIIEDQWRKELQASLDEEETRRQQELAREQEDEEALHKEKMENKQKKLASRVPGKTAAPSQPVT